jgi:hypothetical protein
MKNRKTKSKKLENRGRMLGVTSFAIGLTEIMAAKQLDKFLGTGKGENSGIFQVLGVREIMHGLDLLSHKEKSAGIFARVAGDVLDTALLGVAAQKSSKPMNVLLAAGLVMPVVVSDLREAGRGLAI